MADDSNAPLIDCDCGHSVSNPIDCLDCKRRMCPECYEQHKVKQAVDENGATISVKLEEAFYWPCPACGHMNMSKMRRHDGSIPLSDAEIDDLRQHLGLEPWEKLPPTSELGGVLIDVPANVTCLNCKTSFVAEPPDTLTSGDYETDDDDAETDEDSD